MQDVSPTVSAVGEEPPGRRPFWRGRKGGCLAVALLPVIGLFLLVKVPMWVDDGKLEDMISRLESHPLPPRTSWPDYGGADGSIALRGNGNHCDYRARFTLETDLSVRELTDYYDRADIAGIEGGRPSITVWARQPSERAAYDHRAVIVELYDSTGPGLDMRCT
ncbi:hypothetical protein [Streptosporangium carneum]|uniref:Uncharacterized protein n=1 Tax=Streptosporangium carneum TaxID=47481 RepID=A0A9W6I3W3_9ACTN|nr:hypothetical protein [Streptosporangium carneum]GLK10718.1 hypothetical protein GCM10017600_41240 [Streptosporangium carneum]